MSLWLVRRVCVDDNQALLSFNFSINIQKVSIMREGHWAVHDFIALPLVKHSGPFIPDTEARDQQWTADNPAPRSHETQPQWRGSIRSFG
jgi:hypothetical protein